MAYKCANSNRIEEETFESLLDFNLSISRTDGQDVFEVRGSFNQGVDLLHLAQELRYAQAADKRRIGVSRLQLIDEEAEGTMEDSYLWHTFDKTESLYIREKDGFFTLYGFKDIGEIIPILVDIKYFIEKQ
jgi:hypothetical protein